MNTNDLEKQEEDIEQNIVVEYSDGSKQEIRKTSWLNRADKNKLYELMVKIEPDIKEEKKPIWEEIQKIVFQEKEAKPNAATYFLTGTVLEKKKDVVSREESYFGGRKYKIESYGQSFYQIKVDTGLGGELGIKRFWCFKDVLNENWTKVEAVATGEKYEFEVARTNTSGGYNFLKLRDLRKL